MRYALLVFVMMLLGDARAQDKPGAAPGKEPPTLPPATSAGAKALKPDELAPIKLKLPGAQFIGTPVQPAHVNIDPKTHGKRRGDFLAPRGIHLLSAGKKATLSDPAPLTGDPEMVTDQDKEGANGSAVEMGLGTQWAQVDLGEPAQIWAIIIWHEHSKPRVYRDVIVQISNDPRFEKDVTTLFNNDDDNSSGLGVGRDFEYFDSNEGKLIDGQGKTARYVRCYSRGNTEDNQNHVTEIEIWGK